MSPLREFKSLTTRFDEDKKIEPLSRYYLIFEGANTERKYFQGIINDRKEIGINMQVELIILLKEGEIKNFSNPYKLLELIEDKKRDLKRNGDFDGKIDQFVLIFDRDSYESIDDYVKFIEKATSGNHLIVTSPCFELWLILHYENAIEKYVEPNRDQLLKNEKVSNAHSFASKLFSDLSGTNPKSGTFFNKIKGGIDLAIEQEKLVEQDVLKMSSEIGSRVGVLITQMRKDPRDEL